MRLNNVLLILTFFTSGLYADGIHTININGIGRQYIIYKPIALLSQQKYPLVIDFHGGGGTAKSTEKNFGFDDIADTKKFIVVYPEGLNKGWNDGRTDSKLKHTADDITFIKELIDKMVKEENADPRKIYAAGISNGAFFSIYLAEKLKGKLRAIAAVCGNITEEMKDSFALPVPVSLLLINGTGDPLVKYDGGAIVSERAKRGMSMSTDFTIKKWLQADKITAAAVQEIMPDNDKSDGCSAIKYTYSPGTNSTAVVLIKVENGGHTWPGGKQYLPKFMIGKVCRDFDASEVIWGFFEKQ